MQAGAEVNFYTILHAAAAKGQTALGYRRAADAYDVEKMYGVTVNPAKAALLTVDKADKVIVLAED